MVIRVMNGEEASPIVIPLYKNNDFSQVKVRSTDQFFVAFDEGDRPIGCLRFCVEETVPLLRTMVVDQSQRGQGIGKALLKRYEQYLVDQQINDTYLVCSGRLNPFYENIGFKRIAFQAAPLFLQERMRKYDPELQKMSCMRRE